MFLPQVLTAVLASLLGGGLARRVGTRTVYLAGLVADLLSMALLVLSQVVVDNHGPAYALLLLATGFLGVGLRPGRPHARTRSPRRSTPTRWTARSSSSTRCSGSGPRWPPCSSRSSLGWASGGASRYLAVVLIALLILVSLPLPLHAGARAAVGTDVSSRAAIPTRFWVFATFALLYGVCETMNGNWAQIEMTRQIGASATVASLALTVFWGMVTVGRVAVRRRTARDAADDDLPRAAVRARLRAPHGGAPAAGRTRRPGCSPSAWRAWAARRCSRSR